MKGKKVIMKGKCMKGKNRIGIMLSVAAVMAAMVLCMGCSTGEATTSDNPEPTTEDAVETSTPPAGEVTVQSEVAQPDDSETEEPSEPEVVESSAQQYDTVEDWIAAVNATEFTVGIWREETGKGEIFSTDELVSVKAGDNFVIMGFSNPDRTDYSLCPFVSMISYDVDVMNYMVYEIVKPAIETYNGEFCFIEKDGDSYTIELKYVESEDDTTIAEEEPYEVYDFADSTDRQQLCFVISDYDFILKPDVILEDGDSYTILQEEWLWLYLPKEASNVTTTVEGVSILGDKQNIKGVEIYFKETSVELPISVEYTDGTTEEITIYVTRE